MEAKDDQKVIQGWPAILDALAELGVQMSERTARRYLRRPVERLPVYRFAGTGPVVTTRAKLKAWVDSQWMHASARAL